MVLSRNFTWEYPIQGVLGEVGTIQNSDSIYQNKKKCPISMGQQISKSVVVELRVFIDLVVNRPLISHLSLYTRLKPTCDKKIELMGLVYIFNQ